VLVILNEINFFLQPDRDNLPQLLQQVIQLEVRKMIIIGQELPFLTRHLAVISPFTFTKTIMLVVKEPAKVFLLTAVRDVFVERIRR